MTCDLSGHLWQMWPPHNISLNLSNWSYSQIGHKWSHWSQVVTLFTGGYIGHRWSYWSQVSLVICHVLTIYDRGPEAHILILPEFWTLTEECTVWRRCWKCTSARPAACLRLDAGKNEMSRGQHIWKEARSQKFEACSFYTGIYVSKWKAGMIIQNKEYLNVVRLAIKNPPSSSCRIL